MKEQPKSSRISYGSGRWVPIILIFFLLLLWELGSHLGAIETAPLSAPIGVLHILWYGAGFLPIVSDLLLLYAITSMIGGGIGVAFGALFSRNSTRAEVIFLFLRDARWFPFFIIWALPFWPNRRETALVGVLIVGITAVGFSTCYHYLSARLILKLDRSETRSQVLRETVLQALLTSLVCSQVWIPGWASFVINKPGGIVVLYAIMILLVAFAALLDIGFRSSFDKTAEVRATVLMTEISSRNRRSSFGPAFLGGVCLALWQLGSKVGLDHLISSPLDVADAGYRLLITGVKIVHQSETIWPDIGVSLAEVSGGLLFGFVLSFSVLSGLSESASFRNWVLPLLPLTNILPIVLPLFWLYWMAANPSLRVALGTAFFPLQATAGVALLSFFPILKVLWGMRDVQMPCRVFLAVDEALPFAFVAMFFGQAMGAVGGLGFFMLVARLHTHNVKEGLATSLISFAIFLIISVGLRWLAKSRSRTA